MSHTLTDEQLCAAAWTALNQRLGVAEAVRFLSILRNPPRDYQRWRDEHFKDLTVDQLFDGMKNTRDEATAQN